MMNLLTNAFKFTPPGGLITVETWAEAGRAGIFVSNTGEGIAEERLHNIFDRTGFSTDRSWSDTSGFGLGLPLTAELVRLQGGTIAARNLTEGGCRFTVGFPSAPPPIATETRSDPDIQPSSTAPEHFLPAARGNPDAIPVLVVDDDRDLGDFFVSALDNRFTVKVARSAKSAVEFFEGGYRPKVIVCDVMMPDMDGLEFRKLVSESAELSDLPFLFLSAKGDEATRQEALKLGAVDFLAKPFNLEELESKLASLAALVAAQKASLQKRILKVLDEEPRRAELSEKAGTISEPDFGITAKDREVIALLAEGLSDKEIGDRLGLSARTISNRISALLRKTGAANRTALVMKLVK